MSTLISAITAAFSWYWGIFGVDFTNPYLWVAIFSLEAVFIPLGAIAGYRWGLDSLQSYGVILLGMCAGLAVNLAF